jgi:hypothetical protein
MLLIREQEDSLNTGQSFVLRVIASRVIVLIESLNTMGAIGEQ